jgi:hypothetical protein
LRVAVAPSREHGTRQNIVNLSSWELPWLLPESMGPEKTQSTCALGSCRGSFPRAWYPKKLSQLELLGSCRGSLPRARDPQKYSQLELLGVAVAPSREHGTPKVTVSLSSWELPWLLSESTGPDKKKQST